MSPADRRAPLKVRSFAVLCDFRYSGRRYEVGGTFTPRRDVPRHRLDKLWRDGCIGLVGSDSVEEPLVVEPPKEEATMKEAVIEEIQYGEDYLD